MIIFDRTNQVARLEIADRDRFKLLHNMSTNDFNRPLDGGRETVLTTALARIIDRVTVYPIDDTRAMIISGAAGTVRAWLAKHIFWNDKVQIKDVSDQWAQIEVHGSDAGTIVDQIVPGLSAQRIGGSIESEPGFVARIQGLDQDGFMFILPTDKRDNLIARLEASGGRVGTLDQYEQLRVQAGEPAFGHELTEEYIPLEANLWDAVSFSKGCYIGQEIIARMESRGKLAKQLVSLELDQVVPEKTVIAHNGRDVGTITSVVAIDSRVAALGYLRTEFIDTPVSDLTLNGASARIVAVRQLMAVTQAQ